MTSFAATLFRSLARRRTLAHLRELDAHLLADIGLSAADLRRMEARNAGLGLFRSAGR